jgi:hypothetical protein
MLPYAVFAFTFWEVHPAMWEEAARFACAGLSIVGAFSVYAYLGIGK